MARIDVGHQNAFAGQDHHQALMLFEPTASKIYRHPTFYEIPDEVGDRKSVV